MIRPDPTSAALALSALAVLLGACSAGTTAVPTGTSKASSGPTSGPTAGPTSRGDGSVDLEPIPAGTSLPPGRYAMPFVGEEGPARALVDVPTGYYSAGGWVIDDGHGTEAPDEFGDLTFFAGDLGDIQERPCRGDRYAPAGPGVGDLARALVAAAHGRSTRPHPVSVDGHAGLYLRITAPRDVDRCLDDAYKLFHGPDGGWYGADLPRTRIHLWILDVDGRRVVAVARVVPGHTSHPAELVRMAATAQFPPVRLADRG